MSVVSTFLCFLLFCDVCYGQCIGSGCLTTQNIISIVFGCISLIGLIVTLICCYKSCQAKKKARTQTHPDDRYNQNNRGSFSNRGYPDQQPYNDRQPPPPHYGQPYPPQHGYNQGYPPRTQPGYY